MENLIEELQARYTDLNSKIISIKNHMKNAPEGYMKVSKRGEKRRVYYHMLKDKKNPNKQKMIYLSHKKEKDRAMMQKLAQKSYYKNILPILENELDALNNMIQNYHPEQKYQLYENMTEERKNLVFNEFATPEEITRDWENQESQSNTRYQESLRFETSSGEMVRSKSEMIIADLLERNSEYCAYKYEEALYLSNSGIKVHPDFTIMKRSTAEVFYWEHCGMMDDPQYVNMFIEKINKYIMEGIYPGERLILTFESGDRPLDMAVVKNIIQHYFVEV